MKLQSPQETSLATAALGTALLEPGRSWHRCVAAIAVVGLTSIAPRSQSYWSHQFGHDSGWRVGRHPRVLADVNGDGRADVVGFANDGVYVSISTGSSFAPHTRWVADFGYYAGGWRVERHPRVMADVNGDGRSDIVGFADDGVYVSLSTGSSFTQPPSTWLVGTYGYYAGGWRVEQHPRFVVDVTGDGRADIVGFGNEGVYVAVSRPGSYFDVPRLAVANFGYSASAGGWRVESHPRLMADVNRDGRADIVGFGHAGVYVSLSLGNGNFSVAQLWSTAFGSASGWLVEQHPRFVVDMDRDGRADAVGFASDGVYVALSTGTSFGALQKWGYGSEFGSNSGWRVEHPRSVVDWDGDGDPDVVGFGQSAVYVALNTGSRLGAASPWSCEFDVDSGWTFEHPRMMGDVTGDGRADIVGFGNGGILVAIAPGVRSYGMSCYGSLFGVVSLTGTCSERRLFLSHHGTGPTIGWFVVGAAATNLPLPGTCRLYATPDAILPATRVGTTVAELTLERVPAVARSLSWQYVGFDQAASIVSSNGVETRL